MSGAIRAFVMVQFSTQPSSSVKVSDALAVYVPSDGQPLVFNSSLGELVVSSYDRIFEQGFSAEEEQIFFTHLHNSVATPCIFVGLGKKDLITTDLLRRASALMARKAEENNITAISFYPAVVKSAIQSTQAIVEGIALGTYEFMQFKSKKKPSKKLHSATLLYDNPLEKDTFSKGIEKGKIFSESTILARDWINSPPSDMTPAKMVRLARQLNSKHLRVKVLNKRQMEKLGMGALLGVSRGSHEPPYFVHLHYKPASPPKKRIALCGKGITFDSGGLSLKPAASMETMKYDMAGAATVISVFNALSKLKPNVEVHGLTPLTENMPGGHALKPGDVVRSLSGKTIEVLNTDAEGRLVLADTLVYAQRQKVDEIVDVATLTGACVIALGPNMAAVMGTSSKLIERLHVAASLCGEKLWELPLENSYKSHIKSSVADIKNIGKPMTAGTIIGGLFLKEFVGEKTSWAHIDMASIGWTSERTSLSAVGATGAMVRTLLGYVLSHN